MTESGEHHVQVEIVKHSLTAKAVSEIARLFIRYFAIWI